MFFITAGILSCTILFKPNFVIVLSSVFGTLTIFLLAKGMLLANFAGIIQLIFYCTICFWNKYFGELFLCLAMSFPTYVFSIITWHKNQSKQNGIVAVNNNLNLKELLALAFGFAIVSIPVYFVLQALGTNQLLLNTISVYFTLFYSFLSIKRCKLNFVFRIFCELISLALWIAVFVGEGKFNYAYIITLFNYLVYLIADFWGIWNWAKLKRHQAKTKNGIQKEIWDALKDLD